MPSSVSSLRAGLSSLLKSPLTVVLFVVCFLGSAFAQLNLVYVQTNTGLCPACVANKNAILGFSNDGTGRLALLKGAPYLTGGTGLYEPNPTPASRDCVLRCVRRESGISLVGIGIARRDRE